ncbi:hypothetical protein [Microbacterium sp. RURRCA19A]|uniref:hypothetical protein n=1 Tax=Microbacterium sp. RURRCA19A TaxID=1907391 RepID=UPI000955CB22|nr:hypothetical protein [Microbacterium sp. RURRCA19A]SIS10700.1 hypothetical protein SAMN05880568_2810 [Microbacterium sp. RURRCA19A]
MTDSDERLEWLLRLRKGLGISEDAPRDDVPLELFSVYDWIGLYRLIDKAALSIDDDLERSAVYAALAFRGRYWTDDGRNYRRTSIMPMVGLLKNRRAELSRFAGISLSTVMRAERRGFGKLRDAIESEIERRDPFKIIERMRAELTTLWDVTGDALPNRLHDRISNALVEMEYAVVLDHQKRGVRSHEPPGGYGSPPLRSAGARSDPA